jgi:hypothetical protein
MKGNRAVLTAVVLLVLIVAGWWLFKRSNRGPSVDLIAAFDSAVKKPAGGTFEIVEADLNGDKKRAISTSPASRIIWKQRIPDDGWLMVSLGMKPESWDKEGDGVLFRIGISDGRTFEDLLTQHMDPFHNKSDRRWVPVAVDLSAYAGEDVDVIFNTNNSVPGKPDDARNDSALFAAPEIVIR